MGVSWKLTLEEMKLFAETLGPKIVKRDEFSQFYRSIFKAIFIRRDTRGLSIDLQDYIGEIFNKYIYR